MTKHIDLKNRLAKRLDGKKKLVAFTSEMSEDISAYCRKNGIESESELIRQAVVAHIYKEYDDNTLKLVGIKDLKESLTQIKDMLSVLFSYQCLTHLNLLAYHAEIDDEYKGAALSSAELRHEKFFTSFQERLRKDPPFFERILHKYVTGSLDG